VAMDNLHQDEWHFQWPDVFYYLESRRSAQVVIGAFESLVRYP